MPKVSIIMAVHNGLPYLQSAVDSILRQTFTDFEFIIVDDASTDGSLTILRSYLDKRLRIVKNLNQSGLARSLNRAIRLSRGQYIARMDHDDISRPTRLETQVEFLEAYLSIGVVGTWASTIGERNRQIWRLPTRDSEIRIELLFNPTLIHSSVMFRRKVFTKNHLRYDPSLKRAQDYDLWCQAARKTQFANIDKILLFYRIHQRQVGRQHYAEQLRTANVIRTKQLHKLGVHLTRTEAKLHHNISRWKFSGTRKNLLAIDAWLIQLWEGNTGSGYLPKDAFLRSLAIRWLAACRSSIKLGMEAWDIFKQSKFSKPVPLTQKAILWAKCRSRQWGWRNE